MDALIEVFIVLALKLFAGWFELSRQLYYYFIVWGRLFNVLDFLDLLLLYLVLDVGVVDWDAVAAALLIEFVGLFEEMNLLSCSRSLYFCWRFFNSCFNYWLLTTFYLYRAKLLSVLSCLEADKRDWIAPLFLFCLWTLYHLI